MIKLKTMDFGNIGRFVTPQRIDFESMPYLSQVDGINKNTGGSSGAAKSTIFQMLEFILGVNEVPVTVLQSRLTKEGIWGDLKLEKDGDEYTVSRSKASGLSIKAPEGTIEGSNKVAEEYLQKLIGIPQTLLRKVFHKRQKEGGFFIGLTPKESHEFLTETLDLTSWTKKQDKISEKYKVKLETLKTTENSLQTVLSKIEGTQSVFNTLVPPAEFVCDPLKLSALTICMQEAESKVKNFQDAKNSQLSELKAPIPISLPSPDLSAHNTELEAIRGKYSEIQKNQFTQKQTINSSLSEQTRKQNEITRAKLDLKEVLSAIEKLKTEIVSIKNSICPTCTQSWVNTQNEIVLNLKINDFKSLMIKESSLNEVIASESSVQATIVKLNEELNSINPDELKNIELSRMEVQTRIEGINTVHQKELVKINSDFYAANTEYSNRKAEIQKAFDQQIDLVKVEFSAAQKEYTDLDGKKKLYDSQLASYENQKNTLNASLSVFVKDKENIEKTIEEQKYYLKVLEASEKSIKSYINQLFQGALDQIAARANEILLNIPNVATMSVSFEAFKENKNGSMKEEITTYVHMDNELKIPLKSMSGGEGTAVELAVDLAVVEMIETQTGKGIDVFIMDEPMTGMDSVSVCGLLDMLSMANLSKKIIIVDHNSEVKSRINHVVNVVREGQESRIEV